MNIPENILRHYLRNCYFINGTAYAGKSTMCAMLAQRYDMVHCGENYNLSMMREIADPQIQPNLCYTNQMPSWQHFVLRTPDEYEAWINGNEQEIPPFEVAELIRLSADKKVIVDTNIPAELLWKISDYDHVAVMLSPQSMSVERFFDRSDPDKQFLLSVIDSCPDPEAALENFRACISRINSPERYAAWQNSGFFTVVREDNGLDTREETMLKLAKHFHLE